MKPLGFRVAAAADLEEAYRWYERQRRGLGEDFLSAVQVAIETVGSNPEAHPVLHRDTRRILLRRCRGLLPREAGSEDVAVAPLMANCALERTGAARVVDAPAAQRER